MKTAQVTGYVAISGDGKQWAWGDSAELAEQWLAEEYGEAAAVTHRITAVVPVPDVPPSEHVEGVVTLEPCRGCGQEEDGDDGLYMLVDGDGVYQVVCPQCGARGPEKESERAAVRAWNEGE